MPGVVTHGAVIGLAVAVLVGAAQHWSDDDHLIDQDSPFMAALLPPQ